MAQQGLRHENILILRVFRIGRSRFLHFLVYDFFLCLVYRIFGNSVFIFELFYRFHALHAGLCLKLALCLDKFLVLENVGSREVSDIGRLLFLFELFIYFFGNKRSYDRAERNSYEHTHKAEKMRARRNRGDNPDRRKTR